MKIAYCARELKREFRKSFLHYWQYLEYYFGKRKGFWSPWGWHEGEKERKAGQFVLLTSNWEMAQAESKRGIFSLFEQDRRKAICSLRVSSCKESVHLLLEGTWQNNPALVWRNNCIANRLHVAQHRKDIGISQNGWGWKVPLEAVLLNNPSAQAGLPRASCPVPFGNIQLTKIIT